MIHLNYVINDLIDESKNESKKKTVKQLIDEFVLPSYDIDYVLTWACSYNTLDIVQYIIDKYEEKGVMTTTYYFKLLSVACGSRKFHMVKYFVQQYSDHYTKNHINIALHRASSGGNLDIVKYLIGLGANIHSYSESALGTSAYHGHLDVVKYLVDHGADIHVDDKYPLRWSVFMEKPDVTKYLIQQYDNYHKYINIDIEDYAIFKMYMEMKFHKLLLFRIHDKKLPLELQIIIFNYI